MIRGFRDWIIYQFFFSTSSKNCDTTDTTWWSDSLSRWSFLLLSWWGIHLPFVRAIVLHLRDRDLLSFYATSNFLCSDRDGLPGHRELTLIAPGVTTPFCWCLPCSQCFWYITHRSLPFLRNKGKLSSDRALALVNWSWPCTCLALVFICKPRISLSFS